jgi:hypothetical protein
MYLQVALEVLDMEIHLALSDEEPNATGLRITPSKMPVRKKKRKGGKKISCPHPPATIHARR